MKITRVIQDKILLKKSKFVFNNQDAPQANWHQLEEGEPYKFTIKEGKKFGKANALSEM